MSFRRRLRPRRFPRFRCGPSWSADATVFLRRAADGGPYTVESGRQSYARAHIPGAGFADIPGALSDPASPFAFTLPTAEHFAAAIGRLGIGDTAHVVAYAQDT